MRFTAIPTAYDRRTICRETFAASGHPLPCELLSSGRATCLLLGMPRDVASRRRALRLRLGFAMLRGP